MRKSMTLHLGQRFGSWTISGPVTHKNSRAYYPCFCDCGTSRDVYRHHLISGASSSCGCLASKSTIKRNKTHGMTGSPEYKIWRAMIDRCCYKTNNRYNDYGGRGISICPEWRSSFESFYRDMGPRPSPKHSIDRIDNDGDYTPSNCRWADRVEQSRNKSKLNRKTGRMVGVTKTKDGSWVARIGVGDRIIYLGAFKDIRDAANARETAEMRYWGVA